MDVEQDTPTHECTIEGRILPFKMCSDNRNAYDDRYGYIGVGQTYRINGVLQNSTKDIHFWKHLDTDLVNRINSLSRQYHAHRQIGEERRRNMKHRLNKYDFFIP